MIQIYPRNKKSGNKNFLLFFKIWVLVHWQLASNELTTSSIQLMSQNTF